MEPSPLIDTMCNRAMIVLYRRLHLRPGYVAKLCSIIFQRDLSADDVLVLARRQGEE